MFYTHKSWVKVFGSVKTVHLREVSHLDRGLLNYICYFV